MEQQEQEVKTVFVVSDQASGPVAQLAKGADALTQAASRAKQAVSGVGGVPGAAPGGGVHAAGGEAKNRLAAFKEEHKAVLEEAAIRRQRTKVARLGVMQDRTAHHSSMAMMALLMGEQKSFAGHLARSGALVEQVGIQFSTMGGKGTAVGEKLAKYGGALAAIAGAYEVGATIGEKLNEGAELAHEQFDKFGEKGKHVEEALMNLTGPLGLVYRVITAETRAHEEVLEANKEYAKAMGYRTGADYVTARNILARGQYERKLATSVAAQVEQLGAMPTDQTGAAMEQFQNSLIVAARKMGGDINENYTKLAEAAQHSVVTLTNKANQEAKTAALLDEEAKSIQALPLHASIEKQIQFNNVIGSHIQSLATLNHWTEEQSAEALAHLKASVEARGSIDNVIASFQENERSSLILSAASKQAAEELSKLPITLTGTALGELSQEALKVKEYAEKFKLSPEKALDFARQLHEARTEKTKAPNYDFRNARFDIKQSFAEGFDPDRIAVAFTNDLAAAGEMKHQSMMGPSGASR